MEDIKCSLIISGKKLAVMHDVAITAYVTEVLKNFSDSVLKGALRKSKEHRDSLSPNVIAVFPVVNDDVLCLDGSNGTSAALKVKFIKFTEEAQKETADQLGMTPEELLNKLIDMTSPTSYSGQLTVEQLQDIYVAKSGSASKERTETEKAKLKVFLRK